MTLVVLLVGTAAAANIPDYTVRPVAELSGSTSLTGASDAGHLVGWTTHPAGIVRGYVATSDRGLLLLPLPDGYNSSTALDVNNQGVVVGAVDDAGLPYDGGVPAIWNPDGAGRYTCVIPQQFETMQGPLGPLPINGGMAVAVNDAGVVVGWSRYSGFQGGPPTIYSASNAPVDLRDMGFDATPRDVSETGIVVGDRSMLDLSTGAVTTLDLPGPVGTVGFNQVIAYRVNDAGEIVAAARRATAGNDRYLTYIHNDTDGWSPLNTAQLPTPFVGFYDNNNRGDVSASGGVLFRAENVLVSSYDGLLAPNSSQWDPDIGFIGNDRSVSTVATNTADGSRWLVRLIPTPLACPSDIAEPFGMLNFFDVAAFIALYNNQDPSADLADPVGVWNFFDISTFINEYNAGCP